MAKVLIVGGGGMVGASAGYAIALQELVDEIVLIDINQQAAWGHAADINDALGLNDAVSVRAGGYEDVDDDDIVIITSGAAQKPGQTRRELLQINVGIMQSVVKRVMERGKTPFIVVVANPVDVLTFVALKQSGLPPERVFGTGTTLDTFRLRVHLAELLDVSANEVYAYILGEHGDSSFAALSQAQVGGVPLADYPAYDAHQARNIEQAVRDRVYKIIEAKGATYFAIGQVLAQIVDALSHQRDSILPVCRLIDGHYGLENVVLGLPSYVSKDGVRTVPDMKLSAHERTALQRSADIVRQAIDSVGI